MKRPSFAERPTLTTSLCCTAYTGASVVALILAAMTAGPSFTPWPAAAALGGGATAPAGADRVTGLGRASRSGFGDELPQTGVTEGSPPALATGGAPLTIAARPPISDCGAAASSLARRST